MPSNSNPNHNELRKSARDCAEALELRIAEQGSVALMLRTLFWEMAAKVSAGERDGFDELWEGLAVVADRMHKDCGQISQDVYELKRLVAAEGPGAR